MCMRASTAKSITKRLVDHMPEVEDLLRAREKEQPLGKRSLFGGSMNGLLEFAIPGRKESEEGCETLARAQRMPAEACHAEHTNQVEDHHVRKGDENGQPIHRIGVRHAQQVA